MMSFYGFIGGVGQGLADTGKMMQTDALEARRQQRLEEARARQEERANVESDRRQDRTFDLTYGAGADRNAGTKALDTQHEFESKFGAGADPSRGMAAYEKDHQLGLYGEKAKIDLGTHRNKAKIDNEVGAYGEAFEHATAGLIQAGPDGKLHQVRGAGSAANDANLTALERNGHYLVAKAGFGSHREAVEFLNQSKFNPVERVAELTDKMINRQNEAYIRPGDEHYRTPEQLAQEAAAIVQSSINAVANMNRSGTAPAPTSTQDESPPMEGAQKAPDGNWYIQQNGKWFRVD